MPYEFVEDVAIADVAFKAEGSTPEELFASAAEALTKTMVKELESVEPLVERSIEVEADGMEMLLFNFLQEMIYLKDVELLLFSNYDLRVRELERGDGLRSPSYRLEGVLKGERLNPDKHELLVDVKAVTLHLFRVERSDGAWKAFVVLDV